MLTLILLFIVIAISLNYFSQKQILINHYWHRLITVLLTVSLGIFIITNETLYFSNSSINVNVSNSTFYLYNGLLCLNSYSLIIGCLIILISLFTLNVNTNLPSKNFNMSTPMASLTQFKNEELVWNNTISQPSQNNYLNDTNSRAIDQLIGQQLVVEEEMANNSPIERYIFILSLVIGGLILMNAIDFLTIFLGLELQSYSAYLLAASYKNYEPSEAAGLKYFLLGALSSALIFLGLALLYVICGNTNLDTSFGLLQLLISSTDINFTTNEILLGIIGTILLLTGAIWKIAAAPVHAWAIDVYDAIPSRMAAVLSLIPKISLLIVLIKIINNISLISISEGEINNKTLLFIPITIVILSFTYGSFYGLFTQRIKRLLGYSSVLNVGFILLGIIIAQTNNLSDNFNLIFYLISYIVSTAAIWLCLIYLANNKNDNENYEIVLNTQLQGRASLNVASKTSISNIIVSVCLTLLILSVAGIPPMIGFFAKFEIIMLVIKSNYLTLAAIVVIASLISTVYYLNIVKNIWFVAPKDTTLNYVTNDSKNLILNNKLNSYDNNSVLDNNVLSYKGLECFIIPLLTIIITFANLQYPLIIAALS